MKEKIDTQAKAIAANIRRIRLVRNFKQSYVADRLNISQNAYSKMELGYSAITVHKLLQIAHVFEVDVSDMMKTDIDTPANSYLHNFKQDR